jgi:hypothetical protein
MIKTVVHSLCIGHWIAWKQRTFELCAFCWTLHVLTHDMMHLDRVGTQKLYKGMLWVMISIIGGRLDSLGPIVKHYSVIIEIALMRFLFQAHQIMVISNFTHMRVNALKTGIQAWIGISYNTLGNCGVSVHVSWDMSTTSEPDVVQTHHVTPFYLVT